MDIYVLNKKELKSIGDLIEFVSDKYETAEQEEFILESRILANELPDNLKSYLFEMSDHQEHLGLALVRGFREGKGYPLTPKSWFKESSYAPTFDSDYLAIILSSIMGDPFGFETQQAGKLIHDILPMPGREFNQEGCSSLQALNFHSEDVFHPYRADYICLSCLKNPNQIGTLVSGVREFELSEGILDILFEEKFHHLSDNTHTDDVKEPKLEAILFGNKKYPYIRFDSDFTIGSKGDVTAFKAIEALKGEIERKKLELDVEPGDFYFIDNYKWLHGRKSFRANYDGHDRWLRRFNIKTDLNETSSFRSDLSSRMLTFNPTDYLN
jgi:hypothetical protein